MLLLLLTVKMGKLTSCLIWLGQGFAVDQGMWDIFVNLHFPITEEFVRDICGINSASAATKIIQNLNNQ